jgi:hypothetical protein
MKSWQLALDAVCEALAGQPIHWLVVGSVASAIRGCEFEPNDLDLLVPDYSSLEQWAALLDSHPACTDLTAIQTQEFPGGFRWHKLYWQQNGFPTDASFIESGGGIPDAEDGAGVWEGGKLIWPLVEQADFQGHAVPVPPLSVQLESQLRRREADKAAEVKRIMQAQGYDQALARRCLSTENYRYLIG